MLLKCSWKCHELIFLWRGRVWWLFQFRLINSHAPCAHNFQLKQACISIHTLRRCNESKIDGYEREVIAFGRVWKETLRQIVCVKSNTWRAWVHGELLIYLLHNEVKTLRRILTLHKHKKKNFIFSVVFISNYLQDKTEYKNLMVKIQNYNTNWATELQEILDYAQTFENFLHHHFVMVAAWLSMLFIFKMQKIENNKLSLTNCSEMCIAQLLL